MSDNDGAQLLSDCPTKHTNATISPVRLAVKCLKVVKASVAALVFLVFIILR